MSFEEYMITDDYEPSGQFDDIANKGIQAQPDRPTVSAKELKHAFDVLALLCIDAHNRLCQLFGTEDVLAEFTVRTVSGGKTDLKQLLTTLTGSGGAAALGALDLEGNPTTIQVAFDALRDYVNSAKINATIPDGGFTSAAIKPGGIIGESLADNTVSEQKLAASAVTESKIADESVSEQKLAASAVTESKIADGAVSGDKISSTYRNYISNALLLLDKDIEDAGTRIENLESNTALHIVCTGISEWNFIRLSDDFVIASITKDLGELDLGDETSWRTSAFTVRTPFRFDKNAAVMVSAQFGVYHHHLVLDSHEMQSYGVKMSNSGITKEYQLTQINFKYISTDDKLQTGTTQVKADIIVIGKIEEAYIS